MSARSVTTAAFAREIERALPEEAPYAYHRYLAEGPVHVPRRDAEALPRCGEMVLPGRGWRLLWDRGSSPVLANAVRDFQDYLATSMQVQVTVEARESLADWSGLSRCVVVGTREQLPGCGTALTGAKDYEIAVVRERVTVCGYDERGALFGLYNLEARMTLREAPFLPDGLHTIRHSLYDTRMVLSWLGWMEWPDTVLSHLAHDGFDGIFASVYANPNGDRTTAETSTEFYARLLHKVRPQDPARMRDLIDRARRFGIKVYTPIVYQYLGTPESEAGLRRLMRDILQQFPDIQGYVLLTEGFWYKQWGGTHGASSEYVQDWARNWCAAVAIVAEECHRVDPGIEILPWEYNIDFRPQNAEMKRYFIQQLPGDTIPLLTWENGKSFEMNGMQGYLRDYSLNQVGPAEVTAAQIAEARQRGLKVYCKADSSASWQFGTIPYLPFPQQWFERYRALERYGVNGTLESWSSGYKPNFIAELRAWTCWTDAPPLEDLLEALAARDFGAGARKLVLDAWDLFSQAIRLVPDTGPHMGTNNAVGNPLFFQEPPARTATFTRSWTDHGRWQGYLGSHLVPSWPFTVFYLVFCPDFTNKSNRAEQYARSVSGVQAGPETAVLPVFLEHLHQAAGLMEKGLRLYRAAALASPPAKRQRALREVVVAEQIQRMLQSNAAILEFEDLRLRWVAAPEAPEGGAILDRLESLLRQETARTKLSLLAATRDSRLGFQFEQDYVYTPYSLREKLRVLRETLKEQIPAARRRFAAGLASVAFLALCAGALGQGAATVPAAFALKLTAEVDFGPDLGQNFGTLFEASDAQGRVLAGAGFQGLYNTTCRNDRRALQFFVRPAEDRSQPSVEPLPRFSADTGIYIGDLDGRLLARPQRVAPRVQEWDPAAGAWQTSAAFADASLSNGDGCMHLGDGVLTFVRGRIDYNGTTVLVPPENESFHHTYYAMGHLFFFHDRRGKDEADAFTRICALPWTPAAGGPADLDKAIAQPTTTLRQTTWAWGQLKGTVLTVTNWGGIYAFDGSAWQTLRSPDGKSYQVYSMLNYHDRLLLGQYPSGCLFEYDGEQIRAQEHWPPCLPGVATYSREAQAMALYRGDLYATVWPWAELWRHDRHTGQWTALGRLFTRPPVTAKVGHPFEAEIVAHNQAHGSQHVINDWGQRATSLAAVGDALYIATSNKGGSARPPEYTFIDDATLAEYGLVHRLRLPGQITGQVRWTGNPTRFEFVVAEGRMRLLQDGRELAATALDPALAAGLKDASIVWGNGLFGPFAGRIRTP
jgi:hypothetical protein